MKARLGAGGCDLVEPAHALLVRNALGLQPRHQVALDPVELAEQDRARVLEHRLDEREHLEREARRRAPRCRRSPRPGRATARGAARNPTAGRRRRARAGGRSPHRARSARCPRRAGRGTAGPRCAGAAACWRSSSCERPDQLRDQPPAAPRVRVLLALAQQQHQHPVGDTEARRERLGRLLDQPLERLLVPADEAAAAASCVTSCASSCRRRARSHALVLDHVLGRLADHAAAVVEALAARAAGDLAELAHRERADPAAVELRELGEQHGADRDVHADARACRCPR